MLPTWGYTPFDATQVNIELYSDPVGVGYAPYLAANDFQKLADLLNAFRSGSYVIRNVIPREEVLQCIDLTEAAAVPIAQLNLCLFQAERDFNRYLSPREDLLSGYISHHFQSVFTLGTTYEALGDLEESEGSRLEEITLHLARITADQVAEAVALGSPF